MMNFHDVENFVNNQISNNLIIDESPLISPNNISELCDISCLSPPKNNDGYKENDESGFESASFMSVGANEHEVYESKRPGTGLLMKTFQKK